MVLNGDGPGRTLRQLFEARDCLGCGVRFRPRHHRRLYHDRKCRQASDNRRNPVVRLRRDQMIVRKPRPRGQKICDWRLIGSADLRFGIAD
jgi:hypothetical protein